MKNKDKYAKEILDIACSGYSIALNKSGKLCACCDAKDCMECKFFNIDIDCQTIIKEWSEQEYEEQKINLPQDIKVDTPILVSDDGIVWFKRHFQKFENNTVYTWENGRTSWSAKPSDFTIHWYYAKLPESEEE